MTEMGGNWRHICVDMQRMFAEKTPWQVDWAERILPAVVRLSSACPERTVFTRFIPPLRAEDAIGMWRPYYNKWWMMTREKLAPALLGLVEPLAQFVPPARIFDKAVYSPWHDRRLHRHLQDEGVTTLAISGGETDVCVLSTALGAIDLGYRVILVKDALCSGSDPTHDATLTVIGHRFSVQADVMDHGELLDRTEGGRRNLI